MPFSSACSERHVSSSLRRRRAPLRADDAPESFFLEPELDLETLEEAEDLVREEGMATDSLCVPLPLMW